MAQGQCGLEMSVHMCPLLQGSVTQVLLFWVGKASSCYRLLLGQQLSFPRKKTVRVNAGFPCLLLTCVLEGKASRSRKPWVT